MAARKSKSPARRKAGSTAKPLTSRPRKRAQPVEPPKPIKPTKPAKNPSSKHVRQAERPRINDRKRRAEGETAPQSDPPEVEDFAVLAVQGQRPALDFAVVGIGASAGGLEALEEFLSHVPVKSDAAYVVIQHLDAAHKGLLPELLGRVTELPVTLATDAVEIEANHVYVIPHDRDMSMLRGTLQLLPKRGRNDYHLPIDFFLRSLAEEQHELAIAVILSGTGSDGTLGIRAIKEHAGAVFVQSVESAKFDGMPRSVIETGLADVIAPAEDLPARITAYREHAPLLTNTATQPVEDKTRTALEKVFVLLRAHTGNDFFHYKRSTIYRRLERRLSLHQIDDIAQYVRFLRENTRELDLLFKELLIGVTSFFRDPIVWDQLRSEIIPALLANRSSTAVLRAWVPGCSTGEEAYSLAMVFKEALEVAKPPKHLTLQVFATDLDRDAIERARIGFYPDNIVADVSPERLRRFFVQEERGYRVGKEIREMVVFAPQNIIMDPPFTKLDFLSCRNLLIYLSSELQKKLIPLFHYSLSPDGVLLLGSAETVGMFSNLFSPLDAKARLYRRLEQSVASAPVEFPTSLIGTPAHGAEHEAEQPASSKPPPPNLERLVDRLLVQRFAPLGILCNHSGDILYVSGRAGKYFEPAVGRANLNVLAMARDGLRYELSAAVATVVRENRSVAVSGLTVGTNGGTQHVDLTVQRLSDPRELRGTLLIVIADVVDKHVTPKPARTHKLKEPKRLAELEEELHRTREDMQTTREEMQTSQEELKSTNEELQSANEELQSTNEELTTSKEEMQSLNEELQTVNHELQAKVDELSRANNDMKNLLNSTDIATLFLDSELRVRRFTTLTAKIIKLIPGDAGRPITDIASDLNYTHLADDAREVLRTLVFKEEQGVTRDGRWFSVRIMPYRTLENVIDGVVITFTDITASRALEIGLREQASQLRQMTESLPALVWGARPDGSCDYVNQRWVEYTGVPDQANLGYGWVDQVHPDDRERVREGWRTAVRSGTNFDDELRLRGVHSDYRWFKTRGVAIRDREGTVVKWYGIHTDVHDLKHEA